MFNQLSYLLSQSHQTLSVTKKLHALIIKTHLIYDPFYVTKTVRYYALNHDLQSARILFDKTSNRSVYLWNSMIRAYAQDHQFNHAFSLFAQMRSSESKPDHYTFACMSRACMENIDVLGLRTTHGGVIVMGLGADPISSSALVMAYAKLGLVEEARKVFDGVLEPDLVMWNSMFTGYGHVGSWEEGLKLFCAMRKMGVKLDGYTLVGLVYGITDPCLLAFGQEIHGLCLKCGFDSSPHVQSSLVSMYTKCNCLCSAYKLFMSSPRPDLVQWSALITGFSHSGEHEEALVLFRQMNIKGNRGDNVLIASVLAACARLAILRFGREIHASVLRCGFRSDVMVQSALIDMYFRCGIPDFGVHIFKSMTKRNAIVYNTVILGFGSHGLISLAFEMFEEMLANGFKPDNSTFSALLCACSHAGSLTDGREIFRRMEDEFGIAPGTEHHVHMVRLLGMAGELEEAFNMIQTMPEPLNPGVLGALLSCCVSRGDSRLGEVVSRQLSEIDPEKTAYRVMLSNLYASNGNWDEVKNLRDHMSREEPRKMPGLSWI